MKIIYIACLGFLLTAVCAVLAICFKKNPQQLLIGRWEEVSWQYEKIDRQDSETDMIANWQFSEICPGVKMHEAEYWMFGNNHELNLQHSDKENEQLTWHIKGMGNILELKHGDMTLESYKLKEISEDSLVLHFSFDLQVRGIVKMVFKKVKEQGYAKKI